ncbi:aspartyl-phosphate phosphatase Spo0E family protein [Sporosarcina sp. ACRSL]|uniref:aspartyl-phosphate phosphatase Spo0E family protein n=1 Tax=Sporosarcina sp. ACRSL TaxID=2918215 RepID=UPI001EF66310|nr:aspartyl-phosphate phosphatase Spo0E family protein [Sporosarcina sp. ACRSL]MCG7342692.1 aspartyl-phosphate phosphatase Spo0E family protein [Sporosarcina sp. ACRSL]
MKRKLEDEIESARKELITIAKQKGLSSMETLQISKALDCLINEYNSLEGIPGHFER